MEISREYRVEDQQFLFLIQESFLSQHVLEPTRGENVLDIVLSSHEYFSSVFTTEDISSLPVPFTKFEGNTSDHLGQLFVTPEMIAKKIKKTKDNKSPGDDGIPPKLLKEIIEQISTPLAK